MHSDCHWSERECVESEDNTMAGPVTSCSEWVFSRGLCHKIDNYSHDNLWMDLLDFNLLLALLANFRSKDYMRPDFFWGGSLHVFSDTNFIVTHVFLVNYVIMGQAMSLRLSWQRLVGWSGRLLSFLGSQEFQFFAYNVYSRFGWCLISTMNLVQFSTTPSLQNTHLKLMRGN